MIVDKQGFVNLQLMEYDKRSAFVNLPMARGQAEAARADGVKAEFGSTVILKARVGLGMSI